MSRLDTCRLCPRLCRDACPVATASSEAGVPTFLAEILDRNERGVVSDDVARDVLTRCTNCGGCQDHCHLHRPLPQWLRDARARLLPRPPVAPVGALEGPRDAPIVVITTDDRDPRPALAGPVARLATTDRLGVATLEHGGLDTHLTELRTRVAGRRVVTSDGGVGEVLTAAGIAFEWLWDTTSDRSSAQGSCVAGGPRGLGCCGARGPLAAHHPDEARRVAERFAERGGSQVRDTRCRDHLRACGIPATDTVDRSLGAR